LYVCNCNGIREREVRAAIEAGATRPAEVFRHKGCQAQCAKCVCEMRPDDPGQPRGPGLRRRI